MARAGSLPDSEKKFRLSLGMRKNRYIPNPETLVEVTCRTVQSRLLLRPRPEVCRLILGVLGRAQRLFQVQICNLACLMSQS